MVRTRGRFRCEGVVFGMVLRVDAAFVAHLDHPRGSRIGEHGVVAGQLLHDLFDRRSDPEKAAAFDAGKGLFLMQDGLREGGVGQVQLWLQRDRLFRADVGAETALQASVLLKAKLRQIGVASQSARWAERDAGQAQRAGLGIDRHRAVGGMIGQRDHLGTRLQGLGRKPRDLTAR